MSKPSPPPAPNYAAAAQAQGTANVDAARTTGQLNNPNVVSPYGTQTVSYGTGFDQTGYDNAMKAYQQSLDAASKGGFLGTGFATPAPPDRSLFTTNPNIPTLTQTFSPEQQALYNQQTSNQQNLGSLGAQGIQAAQGIVGQPLSFSGLPQTSSYDDTRKAVTDAMMSRADEDYTKQTDQNNSSLIAAGIRPGTTAYNNAQQMIERSRNDARQNAEIAGGNAAAQAFGMDNTRRTQAISEMLAQRSVPLNEITALMSGSQVSNPFTMPGYSASANVQPAPMFAATNELGNYNTDVFNQRSAQQGNLTNGLFGLAGAGAMAYGMRS